MRLSPSVCGLEQAARAMRGQSRKNAVEEKRLTGSRDDASESVQVDEGAVLKQSAVEVETEELVGPARDGIQNWVEDVAEPVGEAVKEPSAGRGEHRRGERHRGDGAEEHV